MNTTRYRLFTGLLVLAILVGMTAPARALQPDGPAAESQPSAESQPDVDGSEAAEVPEKEPPEDALTAEDILSSARIVAHGMGAIGQVTTPLNCLEGFLAQYWAGVRVFEADLRLTRDGQVVLRHDWWNADWQEGISWVAIPTREKFRSEPILGKYTPLSFQDLLLLMEQYPDICVITDSKFTDSDVFTIQFDAMLADARELGLTYLFDRIVVQIYNSNMFHALDKLYPFPHYIYTLYNEGFGRTEEDFREKAAFCRRQGIKGLTMPEGWWDPAYAAIAREYGVRVYVHTVNNLDDAKRFLSSGVDGVYTDYLTPADLAKKSRAPSLGKAAGSGAEIPVEFFS